MIKVLDHFGKYLLMLGGMFTKPENARVYWKEFIHQCYEIGIGSMGIVVIISLFLGAVTTVQTAYQLISPLVQKYVIAQIIRDSTFLELSPTVVCIVLAGVVVNFRSQGIGCSRIVVAHEFSCQFEIGFKSCGQQFTRRAVLSAAVV